ncbi:FAD-dependent oxidoreductase [Microlunatus endophyticus]|uniref:FAD-dependent oxidoreductase n=1 Tax=Microlunatus endophyticus TaxID=1716077 RepID=A0A917S566_9ACTN|nr:FAD-dependent monooxygenase [Microlunatus endophyticus]GGL58835.1 FAD-dependent oxidoreductase [Microlunatus endophyticus]
MKILISGASIAGPAVAYWLEQYGFDVTVVERAGQLRGGGYPIDIRATALEVVKRMGIHSQLRRAHIDTRALSFLAPDGGLVALLRPHAVAGGDEAEDLEVPRGDLARVLYDVTKDGVEYRFNDSIAALDEDADGIDVRFASGRVERFALVVAADGVHSSTRALKFGSEEPFHRYLGYCFAGFTMPNDFGLSHEGVVWNEPGRGVALYAVQDRPELFGFLCVTRDEPPFEAFRHPQAQRDLVAERFDGDGWKVPQVVEAMRTADDLFFDMVTQIRMPGWSSGRLALAGDAAHAPSFLTGQGSSLALVGAYVLAGELAAEFGAGGGGDHRAAFERYEALARPFAEANQNLVSPGMANLVPSTAEALAARNAMFQQISSLPSDEEPAHWAIDLPDYAA